MPCESPPIQRTAAPIKKLFNKDNIADAAVEKDLKVREHSCGESNYVEFVEFPFAVLVE